jgi:hypothetical protein
MIGEHQLAVARDERMPEDIAPIERLERFAAERNALIDAERTFLRDASASRSATT